MTQDKKRKSIKIDVAELDKARNAFALSLPCTMSADEHKAECTQYYAQLVTDRLSHLQDALQEVQGRLAHGVSPFDIIEAIRDAEARLYRLSIPKSMHRGIRIIVNSDEKKTRSYKYSYECVEVMLERRASAWYLVRWQRQTCYPGRVRPNGILWPSDAQAREALKKHVIDTVFPERGCY